jgi:hypothetical protein
MLRQGDILIERLTGRKVMVIDVPGPDAVTCRFSDGRLEERFTFEIDPPQHGLIDSMLSYARSLFVTPPKTRPAEVNSGTRPRLARQSRSS